MYLNSTFEYKITVIFVGGIHGDVGWAVA